MYFLRQILGHRSLAKKIHTFMFQFVKNRKNNLISIKLKDFYLEGLLADEI